ncbi:MAG: hypothetical protein GXP40_03340 [Chloroflexi bacterium]|nr:hypothetical protein [Chloroflexota bacterium]
MTEKILTTLEKWAGWKSILMLAVLELAFNVWVLPGMAPQSGAAADVPVLDLQFWYTPQQVYQVSAAYSLAQRRAAAVGHLTIDIIYPLVYGLLLSLLLVITLQRALPARRFARLSPLFPWLAVLADYLENVALATIFLAYPARLVPLAWAAAGFTAVKWSLIAVVFLLVVAGSVKRILQRNLSIFKPLT